MSHDTEYSDSTDRLIVAGRRGSQALIGLAIFVSLFASPAAAQTGDICSGQAAIISDIINVVIQYSVIIGVVGFAMTYMSTNAVEVLPVQQDTREKLKDYRRTSMKATASLIIGGPLLFIVIDSTNIPWADCVTLVPF